MEKNIFTVNKINERKLRIKSSNSIQLFPILKFLTVVFKKKIKGEIYEDKQKLFTSISPTEIEIDTGLFDLIQFFLHNMGVELSNYNHFERLEIIPKWYEILNNPDYGDSNGVTQYAYLYQLLSFNYGLGKYPTGTGKSEMQLAIIDSYQHRFDDGNVLIIAPTNIIKENFIERAEKWGVKVKTLNGEYESLTSNFNPDNRINILNPTGFMSSNLYKNEDERTFEWLKNVKCTVIDETHHASSTTWNKFCREFLINSYYLYGFSATPDVENHLTPYLTHSLNNWSKKLIETIQVTGIVRSEMKATNTEKKLKFSKISGTFSTLRKDIKSVEADDNLTSNEKQNKIDSLLNYFNALDSTLTTPKFIEELCLFLKNNSDRTYYMLIHKIEVGELLQNCINNYFNKDDACIFISANGVSPERIGTLEVLKSYLKENKVNIIISSTAGSEGMDISDINGVISVVGKNAKLTLQTVGRSRDKDTEVVLVEDYGNPIIMSQNKTRLKHINSEYFN